MTPPSATPSCPAPAEGAARAIEEARIVSHRQSAAGTFRVRVECPALASRAKAGQFSMLRIAERVDPLLGRPLAVYDTYLNADDDAPRGDERSHRFADFVYTVHGRFTTAFSTLSPGDLISVTGPLGNGWRDLPATPRLILVAGGIGQTSLLTLGRERAAAGTPVTFCWGASRRSAFGDVDDFRRAGLDVHLATLDGSEGTKGNVVDLLDRLFPSSGGVSGHVACCGPEPMMAAVGRWAASRGAGCHVSLEAPMACGVGICFTCVAKVRDGEGSWDYKRTCIEGPVFPAEAIDWD